MTIDEAIEVLELHNQWRKGGDVEMQSPIKIGMAIDLVICELKTLRERQSSLFFDKPDVSSKDEWISREVIEYDWDNEGFGDESIKRLLNKGYEKGYSDALNKNIKKTIQKNTIMELYEIEVITEPIYFRKMRVESGYLYNFYDCKEERYQKEWIFVPDVTQQIIIGKTEKLPYDTIMPL